MIKNISNINFYEHIFNTKNILEKEDRYFDCELITPQYTYFGYIIIGNLYIYFGTKNQKLIDLRNNNKEEIDINYISKYIFSNLNKNNNTDKKKNLILYYYHIYLIIKRRSFLIYQSFEIFCRNGKSYFFNLYRKKHCDNAFDILTAIRENLIDEDKFYLLNENIS